MRTLTLLIAMTASLSAARFAAAAGAQEPALPAGAVALVGSEPIPQAEFDHWLAIALRERRGVTDPPGYERCIAAERRRARRAGRKPPRRDAAASLRAAHESARRETMTFLVQGRWLRQEAAARQITVAPERVRRYLEAASGASRFKSRTRVQALPAQDGTDRGGPARSRGARAAAAAHASGAVESAQPVTRPADVKRYYAEHRRQYRGQAARQGAPHRAEDAHGQAPGERDPGASSRDFRSRYRGITVCAPALRGRGLRRYATPPAE